MDYQLTLVEKPGYLHAIATGSNSRETVALYLMQGLKECEARGCRRVLIESRLEGPRLPPWDTFEIASWHARLDQGIFDAIAYVDAKAPADMLDFVENVTSSRGLPLRVFPSAAAAEQWLASTLDEANAPPAMTGQNA
ncbi:MAG: hypothetical protein KJ634_11910 [Gammaproteobacteria bacterium]|nr:hypothetical protein [Gammaproteobacteria bacterium]MBU1416320.1 hypothetical protein [Gammaproteobacteria bacterium]